MTIAPWPRSFIETIVAYLLTGEMRRDLVLLAPIQGGLTTFLLQLGGAVSGLARWIHLPLGQFVSETPSETRQAVMAWLAAELAQEEAPGNISASALDRRVRDLVRSAGRLVVLCIDDTETQPEVVAGLRAFASSVSNLRLLIASHEPLAAPCAQLTLPRMSLDQVMAMIGQGCPREEAESLADLAGWGPPLIRDLAIKTDAAPGHLPWKQRLDEAGEQLKRQHLTHTLAVRLRDAVTGQKRSLLASLAEGNGAIEDYPAAAELIHLGILQMTRSGGLEFASPIVKHWFAMGNTAAVYRVLTENGSHVVPMQEAKRMLEEAKKRARSDPNYLAVDARPPARVFHRGGEMKAGEEEVEFLRLLCESRAAGGRPITVPHERLKKASSKTGDSIQAVYGVKRKLAEALGAGIIERDWGSGFRLCEKVRFVWIEPFAA